MQYFNEIQIELRAPLDLKEFIERNIEELKLELSFKLPQSTVIQIRSRDSIRGS